MQLLSDLTKDFKDWMFAAFSYRKDINPEVYLADVGYEFVFPEYIICVAEKIRGSTYALYLNADASEDVDLEWKDVHNEAFYGYVHYSERLRHICNVLYCKREIIDHFGMMGIQLNTLEEKRTALRDFVNTAITRASANPDVFRPTIREIILAMKGESVCWLN